MDAIANGLTSEAFERWADQPGKQELLNGELIGLPPDDKRHNRIARRIFLHLHAALEGAQLAEACMEMAYRLGANSLVIPDVSVAFADEDDEEYLVSAPAIAVEVISAADLAEDVASKTVLYFQNGAREVWLVFPKTRHIVVYTTGVSRVVRADQTLTTPLMPALAIPVAEILGE